MLYEVITVCPMEIPIMEAMSTMNRLSVWSLWKLFGDHRENKRQAVFTNPEAPGSY